MQQILRRALKLDILMVEVLRISRRLLQIDICILYLPITLLLSR